jgi:excisionase family DNA binding protein
MTVLAGVQEEAIRAMVAAEVRLLLAASAGAALVAEPANGNGAEVLSADQAAAFLGVDRKTVYDYANRGQIPHQRLGKRLLFSRTALVSWLGACKAASTGKGW